ncbi:tripartite tricarboxylate transporter substrate binding protein [Fusibacter paucivorans]|uniref:Tripartite tricarboxylate transporter substrate binding protein n=1 Tax=Fusibacter paucivorans TaxID=76009 RepID=A0ABS5PQZ6_9FIRM|nr:tripartite tricarboxylate transporter substrate binding protein [Fusibacter paucivorans]MBS7527595.1 tripartite tricarboxylate transporter substrate binding protein [Fusibacter paucivorans]
MKKIFLIVLVVLTAMALMACGDTKQSEAPAAEPATQASTESTSTEQEPEEAFEWPTRPVNVTVTASAGGYTDIMIRKMGEAFQEATGQPFVITNVSGMSGYEAGRTAEPDGYNFSTASTSLLTYKPMGTLNFTWDAYEPVALLGMDDTMGIVVNADSPYQTINELFDAIEANPDSIICGSSMTGFPYYWRLALQESLGFEIYSASIGDTAERNVSLIGNQVDCIITPYAAVKAYVESGDFKVLAIAAEERSIMCPDVPTMLECGYDFTFSSQFGCLMAPIGTPVEVLEACNEVFNQMFSDEAKAKEFKELGYAVYPGYDLDAIDAFLTKGQSDIEKWATE